jgi:hypothetical protein
MQDAECPTVSAAAVRMRRSRQRRRDGLRSLWIELRETEVDALVREKRLTADTRNDDNAVRTALYEYLDLTLGRPLDAKQDPSCNGGKPSIL